MYKTSILQQMQRDVEILARYLAITLNGKNHKYNCSRAFISSELHRNLSPLTWPKSAQVAVQREKRLFFCC
jgi:hypothetical protein